MGLPKMKQISGLLSALAGKADDSAVVKKTNNLSDIPDKGAARSNLSVYSITDVDALITGATEARKVATLADLEALTDLKNLERIYVADDGDGKWAIYMVTDNPDGSYTNATVKRIADKDIFDNAMSSSAIKSSYESNADTNAYTDSEKSKLALISVLNSIDLDSLDSQVSANQTAAADAQSTADSAQTSADSAQTDANNAQNTADNALNTAQLKEDEFTTTREVFTENTSSEGTALSLTLSKEIAVGHEVLAYVNGIYVAPTYTAGDTNVQVTVPYAIETSDEIVIVYAHY